MSQTQINPYISFPSVAVGGWVELGRSTGAIQLDVSSIPDKRYYMCLFNKPAGSVAFNTRFNADAGMNYSRTQQVDGGSEATSINNTSFHAAGQFGNFNESWVEHISNLSANEKLGIRHVMSANTAGATNAPQRYESASKWTNISAAINRIQTVGTMTDANSELVVLGWDPADTHTTNFWEELASVNASDSSTNLSSGTITAKKYLWVQAWLKNTTSHTSDMTFNNDATTYAYRISDNGGTDVTSTSQADIELFSATTTPIFVNMFMINRSASEKSVIGHTINQNTAGAGNASNRREFVGKHDNTASQITEIDIDSSAGNWDSASIIKVWGSD